MSEGKYIYIIEGNSLIRVPAGSNLESEKPSKDSELQLEDPEKEVKKPKRNTGLTAGNRSKAK